MFGRIRYKLLLVVGLAVAAGLAGLAIFFDQTAEEVIVAQHRRTLHKLTEAVNMGLESMMLEGHAELAPEYAKRLEKIQEIRDFRIIRTDGNEAFRDNKTIRQVNGRLGSAQFQMRTREETRQILPPDLPQFVAVLGGEEAVLYYGSDDNGQRVVNFLDPVADHERCLQCHEGGEKVRGVIKVTMSMAPVQRDILRVRVESLLVLGASLILTTLLAGYMLGRTVVRPIEKITRAMARVSGGDLDHQVPVHGHDELSHMALSFNVMTKELKGTYDGLRREQDKLTTIIRSACEAIVVTDASGAVVLVNPAAEHLLGKGRERIAAEGFLNLFDKPALLRGLVEGKGEKASEKVVYNDYVLLVSASSISDARGRPIGSAALLRDVTEENRLQDELRRLSTTDALTGLYNRRFFDESLRRELDRMRHTGVPLSIIMFDVDHFKRFNDEHGHDQGDRVLQVIASLLRQALRKYDLACRYGGEEFMAILPSTAADGAFRVAERLRRDVEECRVDGLKVTISLGVATVPDIAAGTPEELIAAADSAVYRSKESGRNRIDVAQAAGKA